MYAASILGNLATGYASDRVPVRLVVCVSCMVSALACWLLWGFGTTSGLLVGFSVAWGLTALATASAWGRMVHVVSGE